MTAKEELYRIVESLPDEAADDILKELKKKMKGNGASPTDLSHLHRIKERLAEHQPALFEGDLSNPASCTINGIPDDALATFNSWEEDGRTTEEIIEEIYSSRTVSNRMIDL